DDRIEVRMRGTRRDLDDDAVTANVRAALEATGVPLIGVEATAHQHVARLGGRVASEELRARLHQAALDADGVDMVDNSIVVDPDRSEVDRGGDVLDERECWRLLRGRDFGRLAVRRGTGVDIFPVNYRCGPDAIYFRSAP